MKKAIRYIDIHGHVNFPEYDKDREEVIGRAQEVGVGMITVGTDIESSRRAIELTETHDNMWATVGIHPTELEKRTLMPRDGQKPFSEGLPEEKGLVPGDEGHNEGNQDNSVVVGGADQVSVSDFQELCRLALHPKVVAIGECGLDYFHCQEADIPAQIEAFERHIAIANEAKKPLMLHIRNGKKKADLSSTGGNAYRDALNILKKSAKVPFNFHFFAGTLGDMKEIFKLGGAISFTGVLTFTHDYDELIETAPIENIMSETDCPYVSPIPYRGKRNEPIFVIEVVKAIARIRGENEEKVREVLLENACKFFILPR